MSVKAVISVLFNDVSWNLQILGEGVLLLTSPTVSLEKVQDSARWIQVLLGPQLIDLVASYQSIALYTTIPIEETAFLLKTAKYRSGNEIGQREEIEIPICYELGVDLKNVAEGIGLSVKDLIDKHLKAAYRAALIGFIPGFLYLTGLPSELSFPRRSNPRKKVEEGSVGIGGTQAGIYSLASPGGWNIIGRTPLILFQKDKIPPMPVHVGARVKFKRISQSEFETWEG